VVPVATDGREGIILAGEDKKNKKKKIIIDLSIPCNVEKKAEHLQGITLIDVDGLSKLNDETLMRRAAEVPKARLIIQTHLRELLDWHEMRKHVPVLRQVKIKLQEIHGSPLFEQLVPDAPGPLNRDQKIQRVLNGMASKMRRENQRGCLYLEAINEFIAG
jgi:glutamyl-tRNA reductase